MYTKFPVIGWGDAPKDISRIREFVTAGKAPVPMLYLSTKGATSGPVTRTPAANGSTGMRARRPGTEDIGPALLCSHRRRRPPGLLGATSSPGVRPS